MKKIITAIVGIFLMVATPVFAAAPALTGTFQSSYDSASVGTHNFTLNMDGTGSNLCLIVIVDAVGLGNPTTAVWNGTSMNQDVQNNGAELTSSAIYSLANPASGSHTLAVTNGGTHPLGVQFIMFNNVAQGTPGCTIDVAGVYTDGATGVTTINSPSQTGTNTNSFQVGSIMTLGTSAETCSVGTVFGTALTTFSNIHLWGCWRAATGAAQTMTFGWTTNSTSDQLTLIYKGSDTPASASSVWTLFMWTPGF